MNLKVKLLTFLITFSISISIQVSQVNAQGVSREDILKYDHVSIYYTHPDIITHPLITMLNIEDQSLHELVIGNEEQIKIIRTILNKSLADYEKSNVNLRIINKSSIFLKVVFHKDISLKEIWYIDRKGNFLWEKDKEMFGKNEKITNDMKGKEKISLAITLEGKLPKILLDELTQQCEQMSDIVDFKYLRNKIY